MSRQTLVFLAVCGAIVVIVLATSPRKPSDPTAQAPPAKVETKRPEPGRVGQRRQIARSDIGCVSSDDVDAFRAFRRQGDEEAARKFMVPKIAVKSCTIFQEGEQVYITDTSVFWLFVRRSGEPQSFWVHREAIEGTR